MGLFDKVFGKKKDADRGTAFKTFTAYTPVFSTRGGALYESELVRSAIDARARHIAKLKVELMGAAKPTLQTQLRRRPNPWQTWYQFLYRTSTILDMQNTAFVVPIEDAFERVTGYITVLPSLCDLRDVGGEAWLRYRFATGDVGAIELAKCAMLTKFQYTDDVFGEDNGALRQTVDLMDVQNQGIQEAVKNAATYRFMATSANFAFGEDLAKERKRFTKENFSSEADGGGILLFPNTYTNAQQIKPAPSAVDAAQMEHIRTNVYNYFGVNADILQNKAFGDAWNAFYEGAVEPFAIQFSEAMTAAIFTPGEQANGNRLMATSNRLQYMSNREKLSVSTLLADRGMLNRDEGREIWNLPPIPDGKGQAYTIRGEYKSTEEVENADDTDEADDKEKES